MADGEMAAERIRNIGQMPVYQVFSKLALDVEIMTRSFGPDFRWLRVQCLRCSESVCANMTEGFYSQYSTEYLQALYRCRREARETMAHICYALGVKQLVATDGSGLMSRYEEALMQLARLLGSIERKIRERGKAKGVPSELRETEEDYGSQSRGSVHNPIDHQPSAIDHQRSAISHQKR